MLDFNVWEITMIAVFAVIIFGPDKLPEFARKAARIIAHLRRIGNDARSQLRAELGPEFDDVRLSDLNPRSLVQRHLLSADEVEDFRSLRDEVTSTGRMLGDAVGDVAAKPVKPAPAPSAASASASASVPPVDAGRVVAFDPEAT